MSKQSIGEFLATLRKANGYTQQEVADKLGISNRTLSGWECDNVLPDILLLPVLAELYGVTVDEILAGERRAQNELIISSNSEKKILKRKVARFSMQVWILLGIVIAGILLATISAYIEITKESWVGFPWWRIILFVGIVSAIVCLAILFAFWKGAELSVDDTGDDYGAFCIILRKKMANALYAVAAACAIAVISLAIGLFVTNTVSLTKSIVACVILGIMAIVLFVTGWLLYKHALTKWGGENVRHAIKKDRNYFWAVGFWGSIPLVLSVILAIVLGCVQFEEKTVIYENNSVEEFVKHIETLEEFGVEKHFPLSELAKTAKPGDEFDLGDGYTAVYNLFSFTIINEHIMELKGDGANLTMVPFTFEVPCIYLTDDEGTIMFFNVRYWYDFNRENVENRYVKYDHYSVDRVGDGMSYYHLIVRDYSLIGYAISFAIISADLIICAALCVAKRNKHIVKL